jgi:hypothetical protein
VQALKKISGIVCCGLLGMMVLAGCGKHNPAAPQTQGNSAKSAQTFRPEGIIYEASLSGDIGQKPWYWFDVNDDATYNASISVSQTKLTSRVTRVNSNSTWGKVLTFPIAYANTANATVDLRIGVPSHSSSVSWKIIIQEQGGLWRNWELQSSTTDIGYKDYNLTSILQSVNAGMGKFCIEIVVEGAVDQFIELSALYVFDAGADLPAYWYEDGFLPTNTHLNGWYDETTNPGFHAVIYSESGHAQLVGDYVRGGKVETPIIPWNSQHCKQLKISCFSGACFSVWVQEQTGQYRQWQVSKTFDAVNYGWVCDLTSVTALAEGTPFSITIADVFGGLYIYNIYLY